MKYILIFVMLSTWLTGGKPIDMCQNHVYWQVLNIVNKSRSGYEFKKADSIIKYSYKYAVNPIIMANLGMAESSFRHKLKNKYTDCYGLFQVSESHWGHLAYIVQDRKYAARLKSGYSLPTVLQYISVNTEIACIIMRNYLDRYNNYQDALLAYGGWTGKYKDSPKRHEYIEKVLY